MKNEHGLTQQQEKFAQGVASGMNQSDAYRKAYPNSAKWKDETLWPRAARLAAECKVAARVSAIQAVM